MRVTTRLVGLYTMGKSLGLDCGGVSDDACSSSDEYIDGMGMRRNAAITMEKHGLGLVSRQVRGQMVRATTQLYPFICT